MPKPTLAIGGTITAAEADQLAALLAQWQPPMAHEEGDDRPSDPCDEQRGYLACIEDAAESRAPLYLGAFDAPDNLYHEAQEHGLTTWLLERADRLAWRYFEPYAVEEDGQVHQGRIEIHGFAVPDRLEWEACHLDVDGDPIIPVHGLDHTPLTPEQLLNLARVAHDIFRHQIPPLVIKG